VNWRTLRWILVAGIVSTPLGCDNIRWGGLDVRLSTPASTAQVPTDTTPAAAEDTLPPLPAGPVLYAVVRTEGTSTLLAVAEVGPEGLHPLPDPEEDPSFAARFAAERMAPGTEFTLLAAGVRVGTFVVDAGLEAGGGYCGARPRASGTVELVPEAVEAQRFLALPASAARGVRHGPFRLERSRYEERVGSLNMAAELIPALGAPWPPSVLESRQDIQVFTLPGQEARVVAATFTYRDRLRVGNAPSGAYSLFLLGELSRGRYRPTYVWYRPVSPEGKGVPRFFGWTDWDGDGEAEVLLELFGSEARWWGALDRGPGGWELTYEDPCGSATRTASGGAE